MRAFRRGGLVGLVVVALGWSGVGGASAAPRAWRQVPSPSVAPNHHINVLFDVACVRADWCVAVGDERPVPFSGAVRAIIEQWDGTSWSMATPATTEGMEDALRGVTCLADDDCTAVGTLGSTTLVEHWDGLSWTVVPSPNVGSSSNALEAVACSSETFCIADGYSLDANEPTALLEQWDGAHWTVVPSLTPGAISRLHGAVCASPTRCFAVGSTMRGNKHTLTLIEMWNGASWSLVKSPNLPLTSGQSLNILNGVACSSPSACLAVGSYEVNNTQTAIAERWNGTKWRLEPTPTVAGGSAFAAVDCAGTYCAAVGDSAFRPNGASTLVETTRGHDFTVVPSASPGSGDNFLYGVACAAAGVCNAVGSWANTMAPPWDRTFVLSP